MTLHTYTPQPMSLPSMNFLHLTVSEIQPGQTISRRPPAHPDTMGENNTPTALKGCGVTMSLYPFVVHILPLEWQYLCNLQEDIPSRFNLVIFPFSSFAIEELVRQVISKAFFTPQAHFYAEGARFYPHLEVFKVWHHLAWFYKLW